MQPFSQSGQIANFQITKAHKGHMFLCHLNIFFISRIKTLFLRSKLRFRNRGFISVIEPSFLELKFRFLKASFDLENEACYYNSNSKIRFQDRSFVFEIQALFSK